MALSKCYTLRVEILPGFSISDEIYQFWKLLKSKANFTDMICFQEEYFLVLHFADRTCQRLEVGSLET